MQRGVADAVAGAAKRAAILALCAGALGALSMPSGYANIVTNGDFASGFSGWTATSSGDPYWTSVTTTGGTNAALIGAYYDGSGNQISGSVAQTLVTHPGTSYRVSFLYGELITNQAIGGVDTSCCYLDPSNITSSHDPDSNPWAQNNNLNVSWGGNGAFSDSNFLASDQSASGTNLDGGKTIGDYFYESGSFVVTATGSSTALEFDANDYQQGAILTDINVSPVPEPGALGLLGTALLGFGLLAARRRT